MGAIYIFPRLVLFKISFTLKAKQKLTPWINCIHLWSEIFLIGNLYVGHLCELLAQPQVRRGGRELLPTTVWCQFPALFSSPAVSQSSLMQNSKIQILNKTFILDSRQPFICSGSVMSFYLMLFIRTSTKASSIFFQILFSLKPSPFRYHTPVLLQIFTVDFFWPDIYLFRCISADIFFASY